VAVDISGNHPRAASREEEIEGPAYVGFVGPRLAAGMDGYATKPVQRAELAALLERLEGARAT
jgi:CheY-like chemotaxis protein